MTPDLSGPQMAIPLSSESWKPSATLESLRQRSEILWQIHDFFRRKNVLAVETPLLSQWTSSDPHLIPYACRPYGQEGLAAPYFLCTSPEFPMKRLLCAEYGCLYQITKAFRAGDLGRWHNPEFTLLEWYRLGFSPEDLMAEVVELLHHLTGKMADLHTEKYQTIFKTHLEIDPLAISSNDLKILSAQHGLMENHEAFERDDYLNFLFATQIEPHLGREGPVFITHFPINQALLASQDPHDPRVALRFELYWKGIELANGFSELQDPALLESRLKADEAYLRRHNQADRPVDLALIQAQKSGLPPCCGIALGIDRLCMLLLQKSHIREVLSFTYEQA